MSNASKFADAVGRQNLAAAAGVVVSAVSNAVSRGWFPSSWFLAAEQLARGAGVPCDPALFGMKSVNITQNVQDKHTSQSPENEADQKDRAGAAE